MGNINLLKAGYHGKVGQTYGVHQKGQYIIKAVPFSHTPHNTTQNKAKNAFTRLNKVCSRVVKSMWNYLNLSDKGMYKNNALCKAWKNALKENDFIMENLFEVISDAGQLQITEIVFDPDNFVFAYSIGELYPNVPTGEQVIYAGIITDKFITKADITAKGTQALLSSVFDFIDFAFYQVWAFKSVKTARGWQLKGLSMTDPIFVIIVNGIFYTARWRWHQIPYIQNGILYLSSEDAYINNGVLYIGPASTP
jgi:hypothetical protein